MMRRSIGLVLGILLGAAFTAPAIVVPEPPIPSAWLTFVLGVVSLGTSFAVWLKASKARVRRETQDEERAKRFEEHFNAFRQSHERELNGLRQSFEKEIDLFDDRVHKVELADARVEGAQVEARITAERMQGDIRSLVAAVERGEGAISEIRLACASRHEQVLEALAKRLPP